MLPWRNSWFQIALFAWIVSGALLIVDYAPKRPSVERWITAFQQASKQQPQSPAKPLPPTQAPSQPSKQPDSAKEPVLPRQPSNPPPTKPAISPSSAEAKAEALYAGGHYSEALTLFLQACASTITQGCNYAGTMYEFGKGTTKSNEHAAVLYRKSCAAGDQMGCYNLRAVATPPKVP